MIRIRLYWRMIVLVVVVGAAMLWVVLALAPTTSPPVPPASQVGSRLFQNQPPPLVAPIDESDAIGDGVTGLVRSFQTLCALIVGGYGVWCATAGLEWYLDQRKRRQV